MKEQIANLKKESILEIAGKHFHEFGYEKTQIANIAKETNISVGTIYNFFESKEGLFFAYMNSFMQKAYVAYTELIKDETDPVRKIKLLIEFKFSNIIKNSSFLKQNFFNSPTLFTRLTFWKIPAKEQFTELLTQIITTIGAEQKLILDDYIQLTFLFESIVDSYIYRWISEDNFDLKSKEDETLDIFMNSITLK